MKLKTKLTGSLVLFLLLLISLGGAFLMVMNEVRSMEEEARFYLNQGDSFQERENEHLVWSAELLKSITLGYDFSGELDHTRCALGDWYYRLLASDFFKEQDSDFQEEIWSIEEPHLELHQSAKRLLSLMEEGRQQEAQQLYTEETQGHIGELRETLDQVMDSYRQQAMARLAEAERTYIWYRNVLLAVLAVALFIGLGVSLALNRWISSPLDRLTRRADRIKEGDLQLDLPVTGDDEIGVLSSTLRKMVISLREAIEQQRITLRSIGDGVIVSDSEGRITMLNKVAEDLTGWNSKEAEGKRVEEVLMLEQGAETPNPVQQVIETGESADLDQETVLVDRNGQRRYISDSAAPIWIDDHQLQGVIFVFRDVTEERRAWKRVAASERFRRAIVDSLTVNIAVLDEEGEIIETNEQWDEFASNNDGQSGQCGVGTNYLRVCNRAQSTDSREASIAARGISEVISGRRERFTLEYPCHSPAEKRWFVMRITPLGQQAPRRVVVAHENITDRKQREDVLRQFRVALDNSADAIFIISFNSMRFIDVNKTASQSTGYSREELLEMGPHQLKPNYSCQQLRRYFQRMIEEKRDRGMLETIHQRRDGSTYPVEVFMRPLTLGEEELIIASVRDITQRLESEKQKQLQMEKARELQASLFPTILPASEKLELAAAHREAEVVSGDFYDCVAADDGLFFLMADVTGHGLDAALITVFVSSFFRREMEGKATVMDLDPDRLLGRLHSHFCQQSFPPDYSLEVFLGQLAYESMELDYAAAGTIRSYLVEEKGGLQELPTSHGMVINGALEDPFFGSGSLTLGSDQGLILHTDGIDEPFLVKDPEAGRKRLARITRELYRQVSLQEMTDIIIERTAGDLELDEPEDDMTIFCLFRQQ